MCSASAVLETAEKTELPNWLVSMTLPRGILA
jgi:hypothetical protein